MSGPDGIAESVMVTKEGKALQTEAVDCRWFIRAPPGSKVKLHSQLKLKPSMVALGWSCYNPLCTNLKIWIIKKRSPKKTDINVSLLVQIHLRFLDYEMENSNECKRNFVAVYDGSGSVEHLKNKFCSTVANDVMLLTSLGVIRMWADETSRRSRFRILFTIFHERESFHRFFILTHFSSTYRFRSSYKVVIYLLF